MSFQARRGVLQVLAIGLLAGCAPALDWRDVRPAGTGLQLQFPCKPAVLERTVTLAGSPVKLTLHACAAGDQTWGLGVADMVDPALVGPALVQLRASALGNVGAGPGAPLAWQLPGSTPNDASGRVRAAGARPDGAAVQMQVAVFAQGTRVFQATVLGPRVGDEAAEVYFGSLRLGR